MMIYVNLYLLIGLTNAERYHRLAQAAGLVAQSTPRMNAAICATFILIWPWDIFSGIARVIRKVRGQ